MIGAIVKPFKTLAKMAKGVLTLVLTLIKMIDVLLDPIKIIKLLLIFGFVIASYAIALIESFIGILTGISATLTWFVISILSILYILSKFVLKNIIFVIDYVLNDILKIDVSLRRVFYNFIFANEHNYDSWYTQHSYEKGNIPEKLGLISYATCGKGFKPFGLLCKKYDSSLPLYSLDANIQRLSRGLNIEGDLEIKKFNPENTRFFDYSKNRKKQEMNRAGISQKLYHKESIFKLENYDKLTKSSCILANHLLGDSEDYEQLEKMKHACHLKYCKNGHFENFCADSKYTKTKYNTDLIEQYLHFGTLLVTIILFTGIFILSRYRNELKI